MKWRPAFPDRLSFLCAGKMKLNMKNRNLYRCSYHSCTRSVLKLTVTATLNDDNLPTLYQTLCLVLFENVCENY